MQNKQIVDFNPINFCYALQEAVQDGWEIDSEADFSMHFNLFTIGVMKREDSVKVAAVFVQESVKKAGRPPNKDAH